MRLKLKILLLDVALLLSMLVPGQALGNNAGDTAPVPEPTPLLLVGIGLVGYAVLRKRMHK